ncbi:MAG: large conductance mechanosensitive channel protein MscL [Actinomycetota bacterium]|nr:MAG: large conductance mechanosensitive channel protein MscL [Actinomycetota bacterium]
MIKGFRDFIMRGNVVDLAVAFVIGVAFTAVIQAIVNGLINPLIAAIFGKPDLSSAMTFTINNAQFSIGLILQALIYFVAVAAVVYFVVVEPMNRIKARYSRPGEAPVEPDDVVLLREIRDELRSRNGA